MLLDTNVLSEQMRVRPDRNVVLFFEAVDSKLSFISAPTIAELRFGAYQLAPSRRRSELEAAIDRLEAEVFAGRILPSDAEAAHFHALIRAERQAMGRPIGLIDAQIAAIARANRMRLATRNIRDFADTGIDLVDPFAL